MVLLLFLYGVLVYFPIFVTLGGVGVDLLRKNYTRIFACFSNVSPRRFPIGFPTDFPLVGGQRSFTPSRHMTDVEKLNNDILLRDAKSHAVVVVNKLS